MPSHRNVVVKAYNKETISKVKVRSIRREARMMRAINDHRYQWYLCPSLDQTSGLITAMAFYWVNLLGCRVPSVVGFFGAFQDDKCMYIVMECCESGDLLEKLLAEGRAMSEKRVVNEVCFKHS